jgi:hypothetical protein
MKDPIFSEFTRSLNLHPGATQGRDHFLLYKDLIVNPTWLNEGRHGRLRSEEPGRGGDEGDIVTVGSSEIAAASRRQY